MTAGRHFVERVAGGRGRRAHEQRQVVGSGRTRRRVEREREREGYTGARIRVGYDSSPKATFFSVIEVGKKRLRGSAFLVPFRTLHCISASKSMFVELAKILGVTGD